MGNLYETKNKTDRKYTNSQLQQDRTYYYHYDVEGNLIFKEHIKDVGYRPVFSGGELRDRGIQPKSTGKGMLYTWNANGSLRSVTDLQGTTYRFRYDAFGRRLEKRRMASTFRFVWDGNVLLHETFKRDNSEKVELTTWVFEGFVPTAKLVNGKVYSIFSDHLGTPILAVDSDGMEVWNRQLDIYGRVKREIKASSLGDDVFPFVPFLYQGQYYDFETNLAYNRFRYYSPESGTYISQDPIRLAGNNPNFYGYTFDSNTEVDVLGLNILDDILANPASVWGKSAKELEDEINKTEGINASTNKTTKGSKKADKVSINGKSQISQIQVHPGGGRHTEGPYYKISTSSKGIIKVIDPTDYKYQGDNCLFYDYNGNRGHFIENGIDEKGKTTYIWQELEHNH